MSGPCPSPVQLAEALAAARALRESGRDDSHLAWALECVHARCMTREELLRQVDRYLRFGMPEHELAQMRRLSDHLRGQALAGGRTATSGEDLPL